MRIWLQKQKKKEEAKAAAQAATHVPETTPAATEAPSEVEGADKPVNSVEEAPATGEASTEPTAVETDAGDGEVRTVSASAQPNEVGRRFPSSAFHSRAYGHKYQVPKARKLERVDSMNTIYRARTGGCSIRISHSALTDIEQDSAAPGPDDPKRRGSLVSQTATQNAEPSAANASSEEQSNPNGPLGMSNHSIMNGMQGQMGFGFQGQGNFGGMGFNGMSNWNNMNPMGMSTSLDMSQTLTLMPT